MAGFPLHEIWNSLPGVSPVRKFTSCQVAIERIWKAIQKLAPKEGAQALSVATKRARLAKGTTSDSEARVGGKTATVLEWLRRPESAALAAGTGTAVQEIFTSARGIHPGLVLRKRQCYWLANVSPANLRRTIETSARTRALSTVPEPYHLL